VKKIAILDWTLLKALKEAKKFERTPFKNLLVPKIAIKMEVEVPDEQWELVNKDPLLLGVLHKLFKDEVVKYCRDRLFSVLDRIDRGWEQYSKLSTFNLRMQQLRQAIRLGMENICDECEKKIPEKIAELTAQQQKYSHYRFKVAKQAVLNTAALGTAVASTAGVAFATAGASLPLAVVGLYRSVMTMVKFIIDCAKEAEGCQHNVIYGLAFVAKSYGLTDQKGGTEKERFETLAQADTAGYKKGGSRAPIKASNTAKELASNFFLNSILKYPAKKTLTSVKDIQGEVDLWENKLANLSFQAHDLSVQLAELLEKMDQLDVKLKENEALRSDDPGFYAMVKSAARELDRQDDNYNKALKKAEKEVKKLLDNGFYIPSMAKWITIDELHTRAESGGEKIETLKPILKTLETEGLAKGTLIASQALDIVVNISLTVTSYTVGGMSSSVAPTDWQNLLKSNPFDGLGVPQDTIGTVNTLYDFAVSTCKAPEVDGEVMKILLES
jgi:DNA repair exonuclease SbcCD ATPase subunit